MRSRGACAVTRWLAVRWLAAGLLLSACTDDAGKSAPAALAPAAPAQAAAPSIDAVQDPTFVIHPIEDGQTLWDIARAYELNVEDILTANHMSRSEGRSLHKGQELKIPGRARLRDVETASDRADRRSRLPKLRDGVYHHVSRGESLWTLAHHYDVPVHAIMKRNRLTDDSASRLRPGQALIIPGLSGRQAKRAKARARRGAKGIEHTLAAGETIWDLARTFRVGAGEIMAANGLSEKQLKSLRRGQKILIPGVTQDKRGRVKRRRSPRTERAQRTARKLGLGTRRVARQLLRGRVKPRWIRAAGSTRRLVGTLRWPVAKGWFVRGYGSGEGGYHLAVDIMGKIGWNVRAAAPGIVAYSGSELRGYGNVVMVIHPGGWVTMYAHNSVNFVSAGEPVTRGTILAEVGSTGISRGPHVHFELMHRNKNCDPGPLFRPGIRHRSGKRSRVKKVTWRNPKKRPRAIRCHRRRRHPRSRWVVNESPAG